MTIWYRIFCLSEASPAPTAILQRLNEGAAVAGHFHGDEAGWFRADLVTAATTLELERFLASEEGIRAELNSWAAHLETCGDGPELLRLMERMIQTRQLFALERPEASIDPSLTDGICIGVCRFLSETTDGVYQIDGQGFFAADGALLVRDE
jgi:hypothetical protein